jgi:hypothetical protein
MVNTFSRTPRRTMAISGANLYADGVVPPCLMNGRYVWYRWEPDDDVSTCLWMPVLVPEA